VPLLSPLEASNVCRQGPLGRPGSFPQKRPEGQLAGGDEQPIIEIFKKNGGDEQPIIEIFKKIGGDEQPIIEAFQTS